MFRSTLRLAFLGITACGASAYAVDSVAQDRTAEGGATAQEDTLDTVIVTAQKRAENLQTVPLALSAYSADYLASQNIQNLTDLKYRVPSLVYDEFSAGQPRYYIRGIGNNIQSGSVDEDVGVFVDGVYLSRPEMSNTDFVNLERVEILRGPQGTLFGRNVVGGAISFWSKPPTEELEMGGNVTAGNYNEMGASGYVSGPLSETFFASLAATTRNRDGYDFNKTTQNDIEDSQLTAARTTLRFVPNEDLDIRLYGDIARRRGTGSWSIPYVVGPGFTGTPQTGTRRRTHFSDDGYADVDNAGLSLNIDWETALGTLTSISAYRDNTMAVRFAVTTEIEAKPADEQSYFIQQYGTQSKQISQELRLASSGDQRLKWVAGLYYFNGDVFYNSTDQYRFLCCGEDAFIGFDSDSTAESYAAFANVSFDLTEKFGVQAGLRYSRDSKEIEFRTFGKPAFAEFTVDGVPSPGGWQTSSEKSWEDVTPTLSLNYAVTSDKFLYATASRGFKSGGFAKGNEELRSAEVPFDPEYAWNYEIGAKTEWLDRRLRFNISAFYIDYTDLQLRILVQVLPPPNNPDEIVANAGKTVSKGVETEWNFIVAPGLNVYGSYTFLDTEIKEMILNGIDQAGNRLAKSPEHKAFLGGSYSWALSPALTATARLDYLYESDYHSNPTNNPIEVVPSQGLLGAGFMVEGAEGRWSLELWGKNLTDEFHPSQITDVQGNGWAVPIDPARTYGVTVRFKN